MKARITTTSSAWTGRVEEFVDCGIERRQNDVATRLGFVIEEHNLILYGRCRRENCPHRRKRS
jgi:Fur family ferric uptake transcriptional regulator